MKNVIKKMSLLILLVTGSTYAAQQMPEEGITENLFDAACRILTKDDFDNFMVSYMGQFKQVFSLNFSQISPELPLPSLEEIEQLGYQAGAESFRENLRIHNKPFDINPKAFSLFMVQFMRHFMVIFTAQFPAELLLPTLAEIKSAGIIQGINQFRILNNNDDAFSE